MGPDPLFAGGPAREAGAARSAADTWGGPAQKNLGCISYAKITWEIVRFYLTHI